MGSVWIVWVYNMPRLVFSVFTSLLCWLAFSVPSSAVQDQLCTIGANGVSDDLSTDSDDNYRCYVDMQGAKVTFYGLYLCAAEPTLETYRTACDPLFESDTGQLVTFESGADVAMPTNGALSLSVGTYSYMAMRIGSEIYNKMAVQFSEDKRGKTGTGRWCYTLDNTEYVKSNRDVDFAAIECGSSPNAGWAYEKGAYTCSGGVMLATKGWNTNSFGKSSASYKVTLEDNQHNFGGASCPSDTSTAGTIAARNVSFQQLRTPAVISPSTSQIKFSMGFTGYGMIQQRRRNSGGRCNVAGNDCVVTMRSKAPEFIVDVL